MPRSQNQPWRTRKQPVADEWILKSIAEAGGISKYDPQTGFYAWMIMRLKPGEDVAVWHKALRRSAVYLWRNGIADIGIHCELKRDARGRYIRYVAIHKTYTRKYILDTYGSDKRKWPYDPHTRSTKLDCKLPDLPSP